MLIPECYHRNVGFVAKVLSEREYTRVGDVPARTEAENARVFIASAIANGTMDARRPDGKYVRVYFLNARPDDVVELNTMYAKGGDTAASSGSDVGKPDAIEITLNIERGIDLDYQHPATNGGDARMDGDDDGGDNDSSAGDAAVISHVILIIGHKLTPHARDVMNASGVTWEQHTYQSMCMSPTDNIRVGNHRRLSPREARELLRIRTRPVLHLVIPPALLFDGTSPGDMERAETAARQCAYARSVGAPDVDETTTHLVVGQCTATHTLGAWTFRNGGVESVVPFRSLDNVFPDCIVAGVVVAASPTLDSADEHTVYWALSVSLPRTWRRVPPANVRRDTGMRGHQDDFVTEMSTVCGQRSRLAGKNVEYPCTKLSCFCQPWLLTTSRIAHHYGWAHGDMVRVTEDSTSAVVNVRYMVVVDPGK